jgi:hypothetical protein
MNLPSDVHPPSFFDSNDRSYFLVVLDSESQLQTPFHGRAFPCLIWDTHGTWSDDAKAQLVSGLIDAGCRYFVCGGRTCDRWEFLADKAFLELNLRDEEYEARFVMTTSHRDETVDDVAFFFVMNTCFDHHDFRDYLVLQIGGDDAVERLLREQVTLHASPQCTEP